MTVVSGTAVWAMHATHGFPLELSLPLLADQDKVPAWDQLLTAAKADGANIPKLVARILGIVPDAYDPTAAAHIRQWLPRLVAA